MGGQFFFVCGGEGGGHINGESVLHGGAKNMYHKIHFSAIQTL